MRNPRDMRTIQIEVTNACVRSCGNCTRFCGHHKNPFYMDIETFKKAVDSLEGFEGIVGIMGGEPTLHPDFKEMASYIREKFGNISRMNTDKLVLNDFPAYIACKQGASMTINKDGGAGLWTSITKQYYKHYELIQDTFSFQNLNDHSKVSYHQPVLVTRKEYGIPDSEWISLRNDCWIQNYWSASVTPKGVFFCEVAAALDILFEGEGGFPIEKGWWKRDILEFESQFHWCEMCGVALKTFDKHKRDANEGIDDISPNMLEKLKEIESKKVDAGNYAIFSSTKNDISENGGNDDKYSASRYVDDYSDRFGNSMGSLRPKSLLVVDTSKIKTDAGFGRTLFNLIEKQPQKDWVLVCDKNSGEPFITEIPLRALYLNPGCCFVRSEYKYTQILFNVNSDAYKRSGYDGFFNCSSIPEIMALWESKNIVYLQDGFQKENYASDIERWTVMAQSSILNDYDLRNTLHNRVSLSGIKKGGKILMLLPASFYFAKGVYLLLENMGYEPHIFIYEGHKNRYENFMPDDRIHTFSANHMYDFEKLKNECDALLEAHVFDGSLMLVNMPYINLHSRDGYDDVVKIAKYAAKNEKKFIGCLNIRRTFSIFE